MSSDKFGRQIADFLKEKPLEQAMDFVTRGDSPLDTVLHRKCLVNAEPTKQMTKVHKSSDDIAVSLVLDFPHVGWKPIIENFQRFDNADYT